MAQRENPKPTTLPPERLWELIGAPTYEASKRRRPFQSIPERILRKVA
jgi:hypothetical protein